MFCKECGEKLEDGKKFCASCGASTEGESNSNKTNGKKPKKEKKPKSLPMKILTGFGWFMVICFVIALFSDGESTSNQIVIPASEIVNYKNSCNSYDYETIFRDSEQYKGEKAVFTGKVIQVMYGTNRVDMRVNVTAKEYQYIDDVSYTDTMYVTYYPSSNESRILEDDIITIYGELTGVYSYESVMGGKITIPRINVAILEQGNTSIERQSYTNENATEPEQLQEESEGDIENSSFPSVSDDVLGLTESTTPDFADNIGVPTDTSHYDGIIESYGLGLYFEWGFHEYENEGLNYLATYSSLENAGCAFYDVDDDGVQELFIGDLRSEGGFWDMYTLINDSLVLVVRNEERSMYVFCDDGLFYYSESSGADDSANRIYHLLNGDLVEATFVPLNEWEFEMGQLPYEPLTDHLLIP